MRRLACVILVDRHGHLLLQERDENAPVDPADVDEMPWGCFAEDYARALVDSVEYAALRRDAGSAR